MQKTVLVALRKYDRLDGAVSCLEDVMKPGMKVVFLVPYSVQAWPYLPDHCDDAEIGRAATLVGANLIERCGWESQKKLAENKVSGARERLHKRSIETETRLYTGSLGKALQDYTAQAEVHWIATPAQAPNWINWMLRKLTAPFAAADRPETSSLFIRQLSGA